MPEVVGCISLEWGWIFLLPVLVGAMVLIILIAVLMIKGGASRLTVGYEKIRLGATGGPVNIVITIGIVVAIGYGLYRGYNGLKDAYFVALNTPGRELGQIREDFQGETHLVITIKDTAKKFVVTGNYRGACVADLLDAICRQYANKLSCEKSSWQRTLTIDLKKT